MNKFLPFVVIPLAVLVVFLVAVTTHRLTGPSASTIAAACPSGTIRMAGGECVVRQCNKKVFCDDPQDPNVGRFACTETVPCDQIIPSHPMDDPESHPFWYLPEARLGPCGKDYVRYPDGLCDFVVDPGSLAEDNRCWDILYEGECLGLMEHPCAAMTPPYGPKDIEDLDADSVISCWHPGNYAPDIVGTYAVCVRFDGQLFLRAWQKTSSMTDHGNDIPAADCVD